MNEKIESGMHTVPNTMDWSKQKAPTKIFATYEQIFSREQATLY